MRWYLASLPFLCIVTACGGAPDNDPQASATTGTTGTTEPVEVTEATVPTEPGEATGPSDTTGTPGGPEPVQITFGSPTCAGDMCWVVPRPQGNALRAARSTAGRSYAVGDHGAFLRFDGVRWQSATLPAVELSTRPEPVHPNLRDLAVLADDDVWIVGDFGTVLHYDGNGVLAAAPDADPETTHYAAIWASGPQDVWVADGQGRISRFDGATWSTSHEADAQIVGLWGSGPDDLWALAEGDADERILLHFDGTAWSNEILEPEVHGPYGVGRPVAISGAEPGRPWIAFEWMVLRRDADGSFTTVYEPLDFSAAITAATDFVVTGAQAWLATPTEVRELTGASEPFDLTEFAVVDLGVAPDGRPWLFGPGGLVLSTDPAHAIVPTSSADPGVLGEPAPPITQCAPDRDELTCAERRGESVSILRYRRSDDSATTVAGPYPTYPVVQQVVSDGAGGVAVVWPDRVVVIDAAGDERTLANPNAEPLAEIEDAALLDDGTAVVAVKCTLYRAGPDDEQFTAVPFSGGPPLATLTRCRVHPHADGVVWVTGYHFPGDTDVDMALVVWAGDGKWQSTRPVPDYSELFPPVSVTASGVPFVSVVSPDESPFARIYRGEASGFVEVPLAPAGIQDPQFATRGEDVYFAWDDERSFAHGAWLARWSGGEVNRVSIPAHAITDLEVDRDGVWLQTWRAILFSAAVP